jgi:hypothetical protein
MCVRMRVQWMPEKWPADLDLISTDYYHPGNATQDWQANKHFYQRNLYKRLGQKTRVLLVPYIASSGCDPIDLLQHTRPAHCGYPYGNLVDPSRHPTSNATVRCSVTAIDEANVERVRGFFQWAQADPMVAGFNSWHFYNYSGPAMRGCNTMRLGAVAQPKLLKELRRIGSYIKARAP